MYIPSYTPPRVYLRKERVLLRIVLLVLLRERVLFRIVLPVLLRVREGSCCA